MKRVFLFIFFTSSILSFSQKKSKIKIENAEYSYANEDKFPGATIFIGKVKMRHEGVTLDCKRALLYKEKNFFRAIGEVVIEQGDTIIQYSDYANYNGDTKQAFSWGNVELIDPKMKLTTDSLRFDRVNQKLFYTTGGTIKDKTNTLKSKEGTYYLENKKFTAQSKVTVVNPEHFLESNHLDYYTNNGHAYLYGPSTITNSENKNKIYAERGFYNTKTDISHFIKNAKLYLKERTVEGDSLYYDKHKGFASATNNIRVIDTAQNFIAKGNYAELFDLQDSLFMVKKAVAISIYERDSTFIHGDTLLITGKPENRIARIFHKVKIFKSDLQGKCDSIHSNQSTGLTKMYKNPVLWAEKNQITGDSIQLLSNSETNKLDSLKVYNNAFIIQKDSLSKSDFNQIKGRNMFGKFKENKLRFLLVKGNAESVYYNRTENGVLETITKEIASDIEFTMVDSEIETIKYIKKSDGKSYPPSKLPEDVKQLRGFLWREEERPKTKEDIFLRDNTSYKLPKAALQRKLQNKPKPKKRANLKPGLGLKNQ